MAGDEIHLTKVRELRLHSAAQPGRPPHVSAASGLVRIGDDLYVIADDELQLGRFDQASQAPGSLLQILPGELPLPKGDRKRAKPDFESLALLPGTRECPQGALLALGSGSRPTRNRGVLLPLGIGGSLHIDAMQVLDFKFLFDAVKREIGTVNIEGMIVVRDALLLFQRGNKGEGINAIVEFDWQAVWNELRAGASSVRARAVRPYDLGSILGIPLGFSDATLLGDGSVLFAAIAEDTDNAYADGPCTGAAIGRIDSRGALRHLARIVSGAKVEGIHADIRGTSAELLLVTDADDPEIPATLYAATLPLD